MCKYREFADLLSTASFDGTIKLWNINTLTCISRKFADLLTTASFDGTIKLWNINTLTCVSIGRLLIYSLQPV